jgi:phosphinothricin acetyltransferase
MIRLAGAWDATEIAAIWNPVIRDSTITFNAVEKDPDDLVRYLTTQADIGHATYVAEEDGEVLGFATYGQFRAGVGYARSMEHTIMVADGARGRGLGAALLDAVEAHARERDAHSMIAGVSGANEAGIAFHAARGYKEIARVPEVGWKHASWLDLVLMQKIL